MRFFSRGRMAAIAFAAMALLIVQSGFAQEKEEDAGTVYAMTNAASGNSILIFNRSASGVLTGAGSASTAGLGLGSGLGSQGSLALSQNQRWLLAANAGSNDVTVFSVSEDELRFRSKTPSGGTTPVSIAIHGHLVYVLNAGTTDVVGFRLRRNGSLVPIPGARQTLDGASGPAEVAFEPDGELLVVTDKSSNQIFTLPVDDDGVAGSPVSHPSNGATPFGFAFTGRDELIVSEAHGISNAISSLSSYDVGEDGDLNLVTASASTEQAAACWVVITENGKFAYAADTGGGVITGFRVARDGSLSLLNPQGVSANVGSGSAPADLAFSEDSRFLFSVNSGNGTIAGWRVASDGSLIFTGAVQGIPSSASGIAAR